MAVNKPQNEVLILRENIKEQALVSYINGLSDQLRFEVITENPTTLEQAMQIAVIADKNIQTYNDMQENIFHISNTNNYNFTNNHNRNCNSNKLFKFQCQAKR